MPLLRQTGSLKRDAIHFHYPNYAFHRSNRLGSAIRVGDYKLIERFDDGSVELFDVRNDISETSDLADARPNLAADLKGRLHGWRETVDAAMPVAADQRD